MERKAYLEKELESEKGQMKKRLWDWGRTLEVCGWKQEEIKRLEELQEMREKIWAGRERRIGKTALEDMRRKYEEGIHKLELEIVSLLEEKERVDKVLEQLLPEEQQFVAMRFEKGYGFDFIGLKMHLGRATLFRMQDRILKKLQEMQVETL